MPRDKNAENLIWALPEVAAKTALIEVFKALYMTDGKWDSEKSWDADTLDAVVNALPGHIVDVVAN